MAARNPNDWTRYLAQRNFIAGEKILEAEIDKAYNDQVYTLDAPQLAISDCWYRTGITSNAVFGAAGGTAAQLVRHYYFKAKDMCSVDGVVTADGIPFAAFVRAWVVGVTTGQVRLTSGASASNQQTVNVTGTTPVWIALSDVYCRTNDTEEDLIVEGRIDSGAGPLYIDGLLLVAKET